MAIPEGTHTVGPSNGTLRVKTTREGAAAKAGHNLTLEVSSWEATVEGGDNPSITLNADPTSIEVVSGEGGAKKLDDSDKDDIKTSIKKDVLGTDQITFTSTEVTDSAAKGDLSIAGNSSSVEIPLNVNGDTISGSVTLSQKDFGIKQFKALMGALKVGDEVTVEFEGNLS